MNKLRPSNFARIIIAAVLLFFIALAMASCGTRKKETSYQRQIERLTVQNDSLAKIVIKTQTETVTKKDTVSKESAKSTEVETTTETKTVLNLKPGATFEETENGTSKIKYTMHGDGSLTKETTTTTTTKNKDTTKELAGRSQGHKIVKKDSTAQAAVNVSKDETRDKTAASKNKTVTQATLFGMPYWFWVILVILVVIWRLIIWFRRRKQKAIETTFN